ncbi:potassium channel family protein [Danxiaibacter flavus]|uniref:Potassium channel family protein n=1 Tax=Danxiaibacter flavus TaxID=3049108 RepID=A0ABV3ZMB4_9BACT|nr:potassium channel family protein [Chitinophagaceae bacterium DXS]
MKPIGKNFQQFWAQETSLTVLLVVLAAHIFIIIPLGQKTVFGQVIFLFFYISLLVAGMFLLLKNPRLKRITLILLILLAAGIVLRSAGFAVADNLTTAFYCILLSWVVLLRTFGEGPVTVHRIFGAIVVYLLISFIFALLYHSIFLLKGEIAFKGLSSADRKEFMYFSLVTLTTVGYGDISPALPFSRSLANLEALIGQLYPAILIARLVSMEFESSRTKKEK